MSISLSRKQLGCKASCPYPKDENVLLRFLLSLLGCITCWIFVLVLLREQLLRVDQRILYTKVITRLYLFYSEGLKGLLNLLL